MSAIEIIDNLDRINYMFNDEKEDIIEYDHEYLDLIKEKYYSIKNQIFREPTEEEIEKYKHNNKYHKAYLKAFQEINKEILGYIVKKYSIDKYFIDEFYNDISDDWNCSKASNEYIYLFIKDSFGDLLINKYTMAKFTVLSEIVRNIIEKNLYWYSKAKNDDFISLNKIISFETLDCQYKDELLNLIDYTLIRDFHDCRPFRKYYVARRIEQMTDYDFKDQTQCNDYYHDHYKYANICIDDYTFTDYCGDNDGLWSLYNDYAHLDKEEAKESFDVDFYLDSYKTTKTTSNEPIFYECNIFDDDDDENSEDKDEEI